MEVKMEVMCCAQDDADHLSTFAEGCVVCLPSLMRQHRRNKKIQ